MLKILQVRLQQYMNCELPDVDLEKAEEPDIKLPTATGSSKMQESSRKISTSALLTMPKPLTMWTKTNSGKDVLIFSCCKKNPQTKKASQNLVA